MITDLSIYRTARISQDKRRTVAGIFAVKRLALALFLVFMQVGPVGAGWDEAEAAFASGDYETAAREYRVLAEQGDSWSQNNLGFMYYFGQGVPQDFVLAYMWITLAASKQFTGEDRDIAIQNRDAVAEKMTPAQITEAERLAREWKPKAP
jgi:hypothetical protein